MLVLIMQQNLRNIIGLLLGLAFVSIGYQHFASPEGFDAIVPAYLGAPRFWTYASGVLEIAFGLGLMVPAIRPRAGRLLTVLVLLMSLANINMWWNDIPFGENLLTPTQHVARLIIQVILLTCLLWLGELIPRSAVSSTTDE